MSSGSTGLSGSSQILHTPGYSTHCPAINVHSSEMKGAFERIPGTEGFIQSLAGYTPVYPGGRFNALHPYDEVRSPQRLSVQSSSFLSTNSDQYTLAQNRDCIQNVWLPEYASRYGPRYDNKVENKSTLWLSRPILTPAWAFDDSKGTEYELSTGFSSCAWVNIHQDDNGDLDPFTINDSVTGTIPHVSISKGLTPVLSVLSSSWSSFTSGSSYTNANTLSGFEPPFVCLSWGVHRDSSGDRRLYLMAATGTSQNDVYLTQSRPLDINQEEWNFLGVRWQEDINNRTGSFILNGSVIDEFVMNFDQIYSPRDSDGRIYPTSTSSLNKTLLSSSVFSTDSLLTSVDGIITLGNIGQQRFIGNPSVNKSMPVSSGSAKLVEMHDVVLWNRFVETDILDLYVSGTVAVSGSQDVDPIFYVPVCTPYLGNLNYGITGTIYEDNVSSVFSNPLSYYGNTGPGNFFKYTQGQIPLQEAHILSLAQLGSNLSNSSFGNSAIDQLALGGTVPASMWQNANAGSENNVDLISSKNPLLGLGGAFAINTNLIDIATGNPPLTVIIASGSIFGSHNRITPIPFCPMDYFAQNTSASFSYSTQRIWPSNHHSFDFNAEKINTWVSGATESVMNYFYDFWGYRQRFDAAKTKELTSAVPRYISYYTNSGQTVLDPYAGAFTETDHFINTAFNSNAIWYVPKVIAGDSIKKGSVYMSFIPSVYDDVDGDTIAKFGKFYTNSSNTGSIDIDDFMLEFVDNGFGGLVRSPLENPAPNEQFSVFYDRGTVVQKHPALFWVGQKVHNDNRNYWTLDLTSSNKAFIREVELTIPENKSVIPFCEGSRSGTITGADIYDRSGNIIERVTLAQPVERLSGSAITIRTFTVF